MIVPLAKGKSKKSFKKNVKTLIGEGRKKSQALAISYSIARKSKKNKPK